MAERNGEGNGERNGAGNVVKNVAENLAKNVAENLAENVLLVIATLIATVTFQAGVNPPGGVWQESGGGNAGKAIFASQPVAFYVFLISNTVGLSTSIVVIIFLIIRRVGINGFPCYLAMGTATVALLVTYASAIFAVTPRDSVRFRHVLTAGTLPFIVWGLIHYRTNCRGN